MANCFTFIAIEKNGSGTSVESFEPESKEDLKEYWEDFSIRMDTLYGLWWYEIQEEDGGEVPAEIQSWFDELELEID